MLHFCLRCLSCAPRSWLPHPVSTARPSAALQAMAASLSPDFDWRNVNGINFVSPVRYGLAHATPEQQTLTIEK